MAWLQVRLYQEMPVDWKDLFGRPGQGLACPPTIVPPGGGPAGVPAPCLDYPLAKISARTPNYFGRGGLPAAIRPYIIAGSSLTGWIIW